MILCFLPPPEKDVNGDTLWVWCYPSVSPELKQVLLRKCCLTQEVRDFHTFVFGHFSRTWYYITTTEVQEPSALNKVPTRFSTPNIRASFTNIWLFIFTRTGYSFFNRYNSERLQPWEVRRPQQDPLQVRRWCSAPVCGPKGFGLCSRVFSRMYVKHGSPVKMMEAYIAVLTKGICQSDENGSFLIKDYEVETAYLAGSIKGRGSRLSQVTCWRKVSRAASLLQTWCLSLVWKQSSCTPPWCWRGGSSSIILGSKPC